MPKFSKVSQERLTSCHILLQKLFTKVVIFYDCVIVQGYRNQEDQDKAFAEGKSKLKYPQSKHNSNPSMAVDAAPFINGKIVWETKQVLHFAGFVLGMAAEMGIPLRWGGDWDSDKDLSDNTFNDLVHFELNI
jgi:peptidoglycan L-alanyl-D-glutamate endopeptidase CwlK